MLPFVTILRLAALHIESGVVWCRNGMSDIRKRKKEIIIWKKRKKEKEKRSNQKIKTSIRLSFFFLSRNSFSVGRNGHALPSMPRFFY